MQRQRADRDLARVVLKSSSTNPRYRNSYAIQYNTIHFINSLNRVFRESISMYKKNRKNIKMCRKLKWCNSVYNFTKWYYKTKCWLDYQNWAQLTSTLAFFLKYWLDLELLVWPVRLFHDATTLSKNERWAIAVRHLGRLSWSGFLVLYSYVFERSVRFELK